MKKIILVLVVVFLTNLFAAPAWYKGKIDRVWHYGEDGFIITYNNDVLSSCKHKYVYFKKSSLGLEQKNALYSMALSAFHSDANVGIVIDIDKNDSNGYCTGMSMHLVKY